MKGPSVAVRYVWQHYLKHSTEFLIELLIYCKYMKSCIQVSYALAVLFFSIPFLDTYSYRSNFSHISENLLFLSKNLLFWSKNPVFWSKKLVSRCASYIWIKKLSSSNWKSTLFTLFTLFPLPKNQVFRLKEFCICNKLA